MKITVTPVTRKALKDVLQYLLDGEQTDCFIVSQEECYEQELEDLWNEGKYEEVDKWLLKASEGESMVHVYISVLRIEHALAQQGLKIHE